MCHMTKRIQQCASYEEEDKCEGVVVVVKAEARKCVNRDLILGKIDPEYGQRDLN